jgi:hypothetical protein
MKAVKGRPFSSMVPTATEWMSLQSMVMISFTVIFVFMPGVARPSFQSAGSYPAQTIMNAFL